MGIREVAPSPGGGAIVCPELARREREAGAPYLLATETMEEEGGLAPQPMYPGSNLPGVHLPLGGGAHQLVSSSARWLTMFCRQYMCKSI